MEGVVVLSSKLKCVHRLLTTLRDAKSDQRLFCEHAKRLMNVICEEGLSHIQTGWEQVTITTPTGNVLEDGIHLQTEKLVVISIIRAADAMLDSFLDVCPAVKVGKILIQRDEETALPKLMYAKVPNLHGKQVILLDPMLATGGSAKEAIRVLLNHGADINQIAFFTVLSAPEGIRAVLAEFPTVKVVTGHVDQGLNEKAYIVPGLGDYGDRYFGTV